MEEKYFTLRQKLAKLLCLLMLSSMYLTSAHEVENHPQLPSTWPPLLKRGDKIALLAPSFSHPEIVPRTQAAIEVLQSWGLEVVLGQHIFQKHFRFAGQDSERLEDIQQALDDPSIKAILAFRGGYGATRIIDAIDYTHLQQCPKWLIGFSDITALLIKLVQHNIVSVHGEMATHFSDSAYQASLDSLHTLLFEGTAHLTAAPHPQNSLGSVKAPVVGGNLMLICDSIGTDSALDTSGKILVIEEINEDLYRLDRALVKLKRANKLQHLAGLVIGHMSNIRSGKRNPFAKSIEAVIMEHVSEYDYPVAFGFPIGHEPPNMAFPHGAVGHLCVEDQGASLSFGHSNAR